MVARWLTVLSLALPCTSSAGADLDGAVLVQVKADQTTSGNSGPQEISDKASMDAEEWAAQCVKEGKMYAEFMQWVAEMAEHSKVMAEKWFENSAEWRNLAASALLLSTQPGMDLTADPEGLMNLKGRLEEAARAEKTDGLLDDVKSRVDSYARQGMLPADFTDWLQSMSTSASAVAKKWLHNNLEWQGTAVGSLLAVSPDSGDSTAGAVVQDKVEKALEFFDEKTRDEAAASKPSEIADYAKAAFSLAEDSVKAFAKELAETLNRSEAVPKDQATQLNQEASDDTQEQLTDAFFRGVKSMAQNSLDMAREWFEKSEESGKLISGSSLRLSERAGDVEVDAAGGDPNVPIMRETMVKAIVIMDKKAKGDAQVLSNITRTVNRAAVSSFVNTLDKGVQRVVHHQAQKHQRRVEAVRDFAHELGSVIKVMSTQYGKEQKLFWDALETVRKTSESAAAISRHWFEKHMHWEYLSPSNVERVLKGKKALRELQGNSNTTWINHHS